MGWKHRETKGTKAQRSAAPRTFICGASLCLRAFGFQVSSADRHARYERLLLIGVIIIALQVHLLIRGGKTWDALSIRITGITLIITAALFLITAGYSDRQMAPVMGLLGTIGGFLLGKSDRKTE